MSRIVVDQQLIENCLFAFNCIRNTKVKPDLSTYDLASHLDAALHESKSIGFAVWSTEDVLSVRPHLTPAQAKEVLDFSVDKHDATIGINWEVLEAIADALYPPTVVDSRYADTIIAGVPSRYDAIEVHGVRNLNHEDDEEGTHYEVDDENPELYSVYLHCIEGGIECIGDFSTLTLATGYADEISKLYQWQVFCFCDEVI